MIRGGASLLPAPPGDLVDGLVRLAAVLGDAYPLRPKHRAGLPQGVAALSAMLTVDRDDLPRDYMARPEFLAAYLHWFLPWNIYRQGRLLAGLGPDLPAGTRILDLGAGPLTFLHALWMSCPDLRGRTLHYEAVDRSEPALKAGRALFAGLAGEQGGDWRIATRRAAAGGRGSRPADLVVAANMLNELEPDRGGRQRGPDVEGPERLVMGWERMTAPGGRLLLIEPGVRQAATQLVKLRAAALERGWSVEAPCTHAATCPLPGRGRAGWCHFGCSTEGAPAWLEALGRAAHLPKERATLAFLLLRAPAAGQEGEQAAARRGRPPVRVVSDGFALPERRRGCYACGEDGLVLLTVKDRADSRLPASGDLLAPARPDQPRRDGRSGAPVIPLD
ncbi:MAG TPA: small ribosomal subunit Rsm22 family protein [Candidatus Krumholzibacteria bacterium]|nr:small ribosomal subunit Rsm22 family protein [Candidatus Krumholzibacteria bacterium]